MFDMVALAYQANLTRVFTFMMAAEVSNLTYNHIGVSDAFHPLSHHQNDQAKIERLAKIQTYHSVGVREVPGEARGDAGRRRLRAGSLDPPLRQQHEQQQRCTTIPACRRPSSAAARASSRAASTCSIRIRRRWRICC